jgi:hypothetical protein
MSSRARLATLVVVAVTTILVQGPARAAAPPPAVSPLSQSLAAVALTRDGVDSYGITQDNGVTDAHAAATNKQGNTRVIFWQKSTAAEADSETCATWRSESSDHDQQGAALRIVSGAGVTRAITVTKNMFGPNYIFNVHLWNTSARPYAFTQIASFDLRSTFAPHGVLLPLPWNLCAQAMGNTVSFVAWPGSASQPAWDDARYGGSVTLPAGWDYAGATGWYIGHLLPGESATYDHLSTGSASLAPTVDAVAAAARIHTAP